MTDHGAVPHRLPVGSQPARRVRCGLTLTVAMAAAGLRRTGSRRSPAARRTPASLDADVGGLSRARRLDPSAGHGTISLRLPGAFVDVDQLTAEIAPADAPDAVTRWPVEAASAGSDGATASVTLPAFALPPGAYSMTVWQGDAEVVRRYVFHIRK